mmetsp:Transcript_24036/g.48944  ORF Transcript_24036/g.48944 Transcript_24036/m.48944 type:complete len:403 (+) Transcript_24036:594-1802(+)
MLHVEHDALVDLVREHVDVRKLRPLQDLGQGCKGRRRHHSASGIAGVAQDHDLALGTRGLECRGQGPRLEDVAFSSTGCDGNRRGAAKPGDVMVAHPTRRRHQDLIILLANSHERLVNGLLTAARDDNLLGLVVHALAQAEVVADCPPQGHVALHDGVLCMTISRGCAHSGHHLWWRRIAGLAHTQRIVDLVPLVLQLLAQGLHLRRLGRFDPSHHGAQGRQAQLLAFPASLPCSIRFHASANLALDVGDSALEETELSQGVRVVLEETVEQVEGIFAHMTCDHPEVLVADCVNRRGLATVFSQQPASQVCKELGCSGLPVVLIALHADHSATCRLKQGEELLRPPPAVRPHDIEYEGQAVPTLLPRFGTEHWMCAENVDLLRNVLQQDLLGVALDGENVND